MTVLDFQTNYVHWAQTLNADYVEEIEERKMGAYSVTQIGGLSMYYNPSTFNLDAVIMKVSGTSTDRPEINIYRLYAVIAAFEYGECSSTAKEKKTEVVERSMSIMDKAIASVTSSDDFYSENEIYFNESDSAFYYVFPHMTIDDADVYMLILPK